MANFTWPLSGGGGAASASPVLFNKNGSQVTVNLDTTTPANTRGLPVQQVNSAGVAVDGSTETTLAAVNTKLTTTANGLKIDGSATTQPISGAVTVSNFPGTQPVSGSVSVANFPATQPVSAVALPLPTGAAISSKQPAFGVAGTPSVDLLTVQGTASMTPLKVDGSGATQPVSGSVSVSNFPATQTVQGTISARVLTPVANAVVQGTITVGTSPVRATVSGAAPSVTRFNLVLMPDATSLARFWLGSSSVSTSGASRGIPLIPGQIVTFANDASDYYIISDTATQTAYVLES